jgi:hypothetical protein
MRRGNALALLPPEGGRWDDAILFAGGLRHCDAWTGTALRSAVEYQARHCSRPIGLGPPTDGNACRELLALIGAHHPDDLPRHFCLSDDAELPDISVPRTVLLPAQRIDHYTDADRFTDILPTLLHAFPQGSARLIASAFGELTDNSLQWGAASPIGTVATVAHEREAHALQVVVCDLAPGLPQAEASVEWLGGLGKRSAGDLSAWAGLIRTAERRELDAELAVAVGSARLSWRAGGEPQVTAASQVAGFTAALELAL